MWKGILVAAAVMALVGASAVAVLAALDRVEESSESDGGTAIRWDSSFEDLDYTVGDTITVTANWSADAGAAAYEGFVWKHCTPKSKKDPATCEFIEAADSSDEGGNSVTFSFKFSELHLDKARNVEIGNGHFKLYLRVDTDGDGVPDSVAGYGINVHVEDPQ